MSPTSELSYNASLLLTAPKPASVTVGALSQGSVSMPRTKIQQSADGRISIQNVPLAAKLVGDAAVACTVTAFMAPFISVVDKAIMQHAAGTNTLSASAAQSLKTMMKEPIVFLKSPTFLWMWATYAATYTAANSLKTINEHFQNTNNRDSNKSTASQSTKSMPNKSDTPSAAGATTLFIGTTAVNMAASMAKDRAYARMFGKVAQGSVPRITFALWTARDLTVIGSSFVLPDHVATALQKHTFLHNRDSALKAAQLLSPLAAQLVATPLHFVALDCYNYPAGNSAFSATWMARAHRLAQAYGSIVAARMLRVLPAYGIGGVYNTQFRNQYRDYLQRMTFAKRIDDTSMQHVTLLLDTPTCHLEASFDCKFVDSIDEAC